jgi:hypothetical protein
VLVTGMEWFLTIIFGGWALTGAIMFLYIVIKVTQHHLAMRRTLREIRTLPEHERT